jgi:hypothetical protein
VPALYKGLGANMTRGAMVTAVEFSLFDKLKVSLSVCPRCTRAWAQT